MTILTVQSMDSNSDAVPYIYEVRVISRSFECRQKLGEAFMDHRSNSFTEGISEKENAHPQHEEEDGGHIDSRDLHNLRLHYQSISDSVMGEGITKTKAHDFFSRINELAILHNLVQKPRDQIADAEALLNITKSLFSSLESSLNQGNLQISDFLSGLLEKYVEDKTTSHECRCISWMCIGINVSHIFQKAPGMQTMLGPMDNRISHKKLVRKRARPVEISHPEEVNNVGSMDRITTEENVAKMFDVLKKQRLVILEELVLNRTSFSKTIKNIFSLSFLVKDGRAKIGVDNNGAFFISPRNAPAAMAVANGEIKFHHFILRFDYNDWKLMINNVNNEEGATQHGSRVEGIMHEPAALMTPPIKKLSRNRGLVIQEE